MRRIIYFDRFDQVGWPAPSELEPFFLASEGREWSYLDGNDNWSLEIKDINSTGEVSLEEGRRIDIRLNMWGYPKLGVLLFYEKVGGTFDDAFTSKGDMTRLKEWVRTLHGDLRPVGLFIPFEEAWKAVKKFMESDGALPGNIEWVENKSLPEGTFPPPWALDIPSRRA